MDAPVCIQMQIVGLCGYGYSIKIKKSNESNTQQNFFQYYFNAEELLHLGQKYLFRPRYLFLLQ